MTTFLIVSGVIFWIGFVIVCVIFGFSISDAGENDYLNNDPNY